MQIDYELPGGETIRQHLEHDISAIATLLVDARTTDGELILERLPDDQHAWLRAESEDPRYVVTDLGRRALAEYALFTRPWPTCADIHVEGQQP